MNITENSIIGQLVAQDYHTASVFKKFNIDFCCNGNQTILDTCNKKNISTTDLIDKLNQSVQKKDTQGHNYNSWSLDFLADYIVNQHHKYVEEKIQEILPFLNKIVRVHGEQHPELQEVEKLFLETAGELTQHMKKEELVLFPFIRKLAKAKDSDEKIAPPMFGTVQNPIAMMHHDHDSEGERFRKIASLTQDYTPPADACNTYRITLAMLQEFEEDLHLHIHLENNILFPKAIELEKNIL